MVTRVDSNTVETNDVLYRRAAWLAVLTIVYNLAEGIVSTVFGAGDDAIALFGFGVDSFVEVLSGIGILHMIMRIQRGGQASRDEFERRALRITGTAFYLLAVGLLATVALTVAEGRKPETTVPGIIIASVSILAMWLLIRAKLSVGRRLQSQAILADAECTRSCLYLSFVLLLSGIGYELTGWGSLDSVGAVGVAWFAWREGREAFQKAKGISCCSCE